MRQTVNSFAIPGSTSTMTTWSRKLLHHKISRFRYWCRRFPTRAVLPASDVLHTLPARAAGA